MNESEETLKIPEKDEIIQAIMKRFDSFEKNTNDQFEAIRRGIAENSARFDQLEAIALEAKSIALVTRSQLTILTEEVRRMRKDSFV